MKVESAEVCTARQTFTAPFLSHLLLCTPQPPSPQCSPEPKPSSLRPQVWLERREQEAAAARAARAARIAEGGAEAEEAPQVRRARPGPAHASPARPAVSAPVRSGCRRAPQPARGK